MSRWRTFKTKLAWRLLQSETAAVMGAENQLGEVNVLVWVSHVADPHAAALMRNLAQQLENLQRENGVTPEAPHITGVQLG